MFEQVDYKHLQINPFTTIAEDAFLLTAADGSSWNTMTGGWGAMGVLWSKPVCIVFVRDSRYTYTFMEKAEGFTLSFFPLEWKKALTFCGSHSGRDTDKVAATGLIPVELDGSGGTGRIAFEQANMIFSCTKAARVPFDPSCFVLNNIEDHYPRKDYHRMYVGYIDQILVREI
ncbi:MAG: flavin reductase [Sphaerochaetaceae bacterium]|jgi:flavin reductase (DIM6/NTAB) family NADH-FMN oxidoreductase RutF|nr:flavin reductase [Sphaerochaetaceae bacterium]NLO61104.1 hypothetical protein [Spirochaetales bacterium]MDD2406419.1 flavin reductase [Sphaerochaetaceae bacterium]MDD4259561.1 flavin reductase [Sphaerochaetaceae bacterium]MDD4762752.1 flavin reductase [Sphaerochaetaceae bacterium]